MKDHGGIQRLLLLFVGIGILASCASPRATVSHRRGLLDAIDDEERTPAFAVRRKAGREQAARVVASDWNDPKVQKVRDLVEGWRWPLKRPAVTSHFGERDSGFHEGVDLAAAVGTPVYSADAGRVLYAGSKIRGYGKIVVLKHEPSGLLTVYAHLSSYQVKKGQRVKKGQQIALSGKSGRVTGPHLHFEIRRGVVAYDPAVLIQPPGRKLAAREVKTTRRSD